MNLKKLRTRLGISPTVLSKKTGISRYGIFLIETGRTSPTLRTMKKIAEALGVTVGELTNEDGSS